MKKALAIIALLGFPSIGMAGPFGFDDTAAPDPSFCTKRDSGGLWYECTSAPKPHPNFEYYLIKYHESTGTCFLKGIGKTIETNVYGTSLKSSMEKLESQISSVYGAAVDNLDRLLPGSIWDEPEDYMMSLRKNERIRIIKWETDSAQYGFRTIYLGAGALSVETAYINIEYYYPSDDQCEKISEESEASSF